MVTSSERRRAAEKHDVGVKCDEITKNESKQNQRGGGKQKAE